MPLVIAPPLAQLTAKPRLAIRTMPMSHVNLANVLYENGEFDRCARAL